MDTTIETALSIVSNPSISAWRKAYWTKKVRDEIAGYRIAKLYFQADALEKQLNVALLKRVQ
jgi:hypothetical protein